MAIICCFCYHHHRKDICICTTFESNTRAFSSSGRGLSRDICAFRKAGKQPAALGIEISVREIREIKSDHHPCSAAASLWRHQIALEADYYRLSSMPARLRARQSHHSITRHDFAIIIIATIAMRLLICIEFLSHVFSVLFDNTDCGTRDAAIFSPKKAASLFEVGCSPRVTFLVMKCRHLQIVYRSGVDSGSGCSWCKLVNINYLKTS